MIQDHMAHFFIDIHTLTIEERSKLIQWWDRDVRNAALENGDKA